MHPTLAVAGTHVLLIIRAVAPIARMHYYCNCPYPKGWRAALCWRAAAGVVLGVGAGAAAAGLAFVAVDSAYFGAGTTEVGSPRIASLGIESLSIESLSNTYWALNHWALNC